MKVILYIGANDCGDREFLRSVHRNRKRLRERGLWYPNYGVVQRGEQLGHYDLAHAILGETNGRFDFQGAQAFLAALRRDAREHESVLLALPNLLVPAVLVDAGVNSVYRALRTRTAAATCRLFAEDDVRVLALVGTPCENAMRAYARAVHEHRYTRSVRTYLRDHGAVTDHEAHLEPWLVRFERVEVASFDDLCRQDAPLNRLFEAIGVPPAGLHLASAFPRRTKPRTLQLLCELNRTSLSSDELRYAAKHVTKEECARGGEHYTTLFDINVAGRLHQAQHGRLVRLFERHGIGPTEHILSSRIEEVVPAPELTTHDRISWVSRADVHPRACSRDSTGSSSIEDLEKRTSTVAWQLARRLHGTIERLKRAARERRRRFPSRSHKGTNALSELENTLSGPDDSKVELALHELVASWPRRGRSERAELAVATCRRLLASGRGAAFESFRDRVTLDLERTEFDPLLDGQDDSTRKLGCSRLLDRSGAVNTRLCDALILQGRLDAFTVAELFERRPELHITNPELDLLLANACLADNASVALRAVNRFLDYHRLTPLQAIQPKDVGPPVYTFEHSLRRALPRATPPLRVSVLMAAFRARSSIEAAVDSVLKQDYPDFELLIADDDSNDGTLDLLKRRYGDDRRVRLFRSLKNQGPYNVRNQLLQFANGDLVTVQDADDIALPERLTTQVTAFRAPGVSACVADWVRVRPNGSFVFFHDMKASRLSIVSLMFRRETLDKLGPYSSARFGADFEMYQRLLSLFAPETISRVRAPLLFGLWSAGSLTRSPGSEALETGFRSRARHRYASLVESPSQSHGAPRHGEVESLLRETGNYIEPTGLVSA